MNAGANLIAPCGMNCAICRAYLREKRHCPGCRGSDAQKSKSAIRCAIKNCPEIQKSKAGYCFECTEFPCARLKQLDKRYRTKYKMSMLENLVFIEANGLSEFIEKEAVRWRCSKCGGTICVHRTRCSTCNL